MADIFSQEEIESLLGSLAQESIPPSGGEESSGRGGANVGSAAKRAEKFSLRPDATYELYDFRRPDKFSKDQLRTLQMLNDTFARLAGSALSATFRAPVNVDLISLEQVPFEEYLRNIGQSVFTIISLPPLSGQAVLEMEFGLVFFMIDRMLGGPGKAIDRTNLTDIEKPLVRQIIERLFGALKTAWEGIVVVNPAIDGLETSSQFVQIAPPGDIVITILFEVKVGNQRNAMSLCVPYLLLKPITAKLSGQRWFNSGVLKQSNANRRAITTELTMAQVDCSINLGSTKMKVQDFLELEPGALLRLNQKTKEDIQFCVEDVPKFFGKPALQGKNLVFSVTQSLED